VSREILLFSSGFVLVLLFYDAICIYGRKWSLLFFLTGFLYSILRSQFVALVTGIISGSESFLPYQVNQPYIKILGTTPQEIIGWLIVSYLALRLASSLVDFRNVYFRLLFAGLTIGMVAYAVETTAIEADWWKWYVPLGDSLFGRVPFIGILDWSMVSIDFLAPFILIQIPKVPRWLKFFSLLFFPLHMAAHLGITPLNQLFPFSISSLGHLFWGILFLLLGTIRNEDTPIRSLSKLVLISFLLMGSVLILINVAILNNPLLCISILPLVSIYLFTLNTKIRWVPILLLPSFLFLPTLTPIGFPQILGIIHNIIWSGLKKIRILIITILLLFIYIAHFIWYQRYDENRTLFSSAIHMFNNANYYGAITSFTRYLQNDPSNGFAHFFLAESYLYTQQLDRALSQYILTIRFLQFHLDATKRAVGIYVDQGKFLEAYDIWKRAILFHQDDVFLHFLGGRIYLGLKNSEDANIEFNYVLSKTNLDYESLLYLNTLIYMGKVERSLEEAKATLLVEPNRNDIISFLDTYYKEQGLKEDRLELFKKLYDQTKSPGILSYLSEMANEYKDPETIQWIHQIQDRENPK